MSKILVKLDTEKLKNEFKIDSRFKIKEGDLDSEMVYATIKEAIMTNMIDVLSVELIKDAEDVCSEETSDACIEAKSKKLSYLLRHHPDKANLKIEKNGWVEIKELLKNTDFSMQELVVIVNSDNKKRFSFDNNFSPLKIRANQGHSCDVDIDFRKVNPPDILYHGTSELNNFNIIKEGLKKGQRQYTHLSVDFKTAVQVGKRHTKKFGCQVSIFVIDSKKMKEDGYDFFLSDNNVWLVDHVPSKYLKIMKQSEIFKKHNTIYV